ncbi:hypothetical protein K431DRAFT_259766 [Polychaeton citri CBS 116435]|uniref:BTB domain-containing protein n=1 Tax=Polychaeton citri CBS 116435 TaxID=1314669 RepID=A0A9P4QJ89_9PEZI|nr:hypothetical protein K431DRAFT_259766 [Polychaeton citri CBS 116435]
MVSHYHHQYHPSTYAASSADLPINSSSASALGVGTHHTRAASVTSGRSSTRRHRHSRNHQSSSTSPYVAQNEFPVFSHTGDVEIVTSSSDGRKENKYLLHRLILSQCSGFFQASTREAWARPSIDGARGDNLATIGEDFVVGSTASRSSSVDRRPSHDQPGQPGKRWRYELDWQAAGDDEVPMLVQRDASSAPSIFGGNDGRHDRPPAVRNKPPPSFFRSMSNLSTLSLNSHAQSAPPAIEQSTIEPGDEVLKDYDNLFRTMYQYPPVLDTLNIATAYTECKALLHLADMYDCLEIAGQRVDHHLLRFGARLFKQIAKYPPSYLKLGYLARSRTIFTEALVHVVGQWPLAAAQLRVQLDREVLELIEDKAEDLCDLKTRVEAKLWRLTLTTSRGERVSPSNDFLGWLAMSLFRQWFAENTTPAPASILKSDDRRPTSGSQVSASQAASNTRRPSNGRSTSSNHIASQRIAPAPQLPVQPNSGKVYRLIGSAAPSSYLSHDELKRFLKLQPDLYTRENLKRFERKMDEIKNLACDAVRPLMRNFLELDLSSFGPGGLGYLTCTKIEEQDLPWDE